MFNLLEKENVGTITLGNKVRISDPCYDADTWCAGTLENVLEGKYDCYSQSIDTGSWGVRIASIEVRHKDYGDVEPVEVQDIDVGVDSGQAGIYDLDYFLKAREDKGGEDEWYWRVCDCTYKAVKSPDYVPFEESEWWKDEFNPIKENEKNSTLDNIGQAFAILKDSWEEELTVEEKEYIEMRNKISDDLFTEYYEALNKYFDSKYSLGVTKEFAADTLDGKCLVSSSGDGDGGYVCLVGRNKDGKIVSIKVDYYYGWDEENEEDDE